MSTFHEKNENKANERLRETDIIICPDVNDIQQDFQFCLIPTIQGTYHIEIKAVPYNLNLEGVARLDHRVFQEEGSYRIIQNVQYTERHEIQKFLREWVKATLKLFPNANSSHDNAFVFEQRRPTQERTGSMMDDECQSFSKVYSSDDVPELEQRHDETCYFKENMVFTSEVYKNIMSTVGKFPTETGGILLGNRDDYIVQRFIFDPHGSRTPGGYDPDVDFLNSCLKEEKPLKLLGFVHSHPRGVSRLSGDWGNGIGDIGYLKKIFQHIPALEKFLVPIMYSTADGGKSQIFPYIAWRQAIEKYRRVELKIVKATSAFSQQQDCMLTVSNSTML